MAFLIQVLDVVVDVVVDVVADVFAIVKETVGAGLFRLALSIHVNIIPENSSWNRKRVEFDIVWLEKEW